MPLRFPSILIVLSLVATAFPAIARAAGACETSNSSQAEMTECYGNAYKKSDGELNAVYRQIIGRLKNDKATTTLLVTAQKAWVGFRDAECAFSTSGNAGGTVYPMIQAICLDGLTTKRISDLRTYLKCEEGALDCPVPAQ
jgi:uncharacterized protein YecT (DUF1311 family)